MVSLLTWFLYGYPNNSSNMTYHITPRFLYWITPPFNDAKILTVWSPTLTVSQLCLPVHPPNNRHRVSWIRAIRYPSSFWITQVRASVMSRPVVYMDVKDAAWDHWSRISMNILSNMLKSKRVGLAFLWTFPNNYRQSCGSLNPSPKP